MPKKVKAGKLMAANDRDVQSEVARALSRAVRTLNGSSLVKRITYTSAATSNASGVLSVTGIAQFNSTNVQNLGTEWASFAARFVEYRVLKIKVTFIPLYSANTQNAATKVLAGGAAVVASDPSGAAAPASLAAAYSLESSKLHQFHSAWKHQMSACETDHLLFNPTSASIPAANRYSIVLYGAGLDASTQYGQFFVEWITEFRGSQ